MKMITLETSMVDGELYYQLKVDGNGYSGAYCFENILADWMKLKDKLQFAKLGISEVVKGEKNE